MGSGREGLVVERLLACQLYKHTLPVRRRTPQVKHLVESHVGGVALLKKLYGISDSRELVWVFLPIPSPYKVA